VALLTYTQLPPWEQDLIEQAKMVLGDLDPDTADQYFTNDQYATVLAAAVRDFNAARPKTDYAPDVFPASQADTLFLGLLYWASISRSSRFIEELQVQGYAGPNIDLSVLRQRWMDRANEIKPVWERKRNLAKLEVGLPMPVGTVDTWSTWGRMSASVIPMLRALPSWNYARP
jgi:hypothetical protein